MPIARLITIPLSHYCEKARWALDATGLPYREDAYSPILHLWGTRPLGGKTVPLLVDGGEVFKDSSDIVRHVDALAPREKRLLPELHAERQEALAIEDELDETLGKDGRVLGYHHALSEDDVARVMVERMMGIRWPLAQQAVATPFRGLIFRMYGITPERVASAEARLRETFARIGEAVAARGYLVGGRFSIADLTFASLAAIVLGPPEHPIMGRPGRRLPPGLEVLRDELAETPAGRFALRMYREHRAPSA